MDNFNRNPSLKYLKAVEALNNLLDEEPGSDSAHRAFASVVQSRWRELYASPDKLKLAGTRHVCVHRLVGRRCPEERDRDAICETCRIPRADHLSEWRAPDGSRRIVSQPYGTWDYEQLKALMAFCERLGLEASIGGHSWHFPGWTTLVEFRRKTEQENPR